jgi:HD-GYP domain-containing protein (c-di-GMP phosphodiesterase class II)
MNPAPIDTDPDLIRDFFNDLDDANVMVNAGINALEKNPQDHTQLNLIFRQIHTIKANLKFANLDMLNDFIHPIEEILEQLRSKQLEYSTDIGRIIYLALDEIKALAQQAFKNALNPLLLKSFTHALNQIAHTSTQERLEAIRLTLQLLDPFAKPLESPQTPSAPPSVSPNPESTDTDLIFFKNLSQLIETRLDTAPGRTQQILTIAIAMNQANTMPIEERQLQAAIYVQDFGLLHLPLQILHKTEKLTAAERAQLEQHPHTTYHFLKALSTWDVAATIVLQQHEHMDGKGYPNHLTAENISVGAQIVAIAQAFSGIVHQRSYRQLTTRTLMNAIMRINHDAGTQFSEYWVDIFNHVIKTLYKEHKL